MSQNIKRLTKRDEYGNADIIGVDSSDLQLNLDFKAFNKVTRALNRLAELEEKLEEGMLIELPCAIGETVWGIWEKPHLGNFDRKHKGSMKLDLEWVKRGIKESFAEFEVRPFKMKKSYYKFIGELVFLTQAEAVAKLKEIEG